MALKFADTAEPMGDFPVAKAKDIEMTKDDGTNKSLQEMYDDGELGGGDGMPLPIQKNLYLRSTLTGDGDLIWTQRNVSELDAVEKVSTYPENQTNKNKVFVIENSDPIVIIDPSITTFEELGKLLSGFSDLSIEEVTDPYTGFAYKLTYDSSKSIDVNSGVSTTNGIKYISIKNEGTKKSVAWNGVTEYCGISYSGIVTLILKGFTSEHSDMVKVFANNVELATKEYAKTHGGGGALTIVEGKPIYGERKQYDTNKKIPLAGQASLKYTMDRDGILTGSCHKKGQGYSAWIHMNGKIVTTFDNYGGESCSFDFPSVRVKAGDVIELTSNVPTTETTNFFWLNNIGVTPIIGVEPGIELQAQDTYSLEEIKVGTWIDGKPRYRKVLTLDVSAVGGYNIDVSSLNIAQITSFKGIFNDTQYNYMFPVPDYGDGDTRFYLSYSITSKVVHYETGTKYGAKGKLIITIEYTKN